MVNDLTFIHEEHCVGLHYDTDFMINFIFFDCRYRDSVDMAFIIYIHFYLLLLSVQKLKMNLYTPVLVIIEFDLQIRSNNFRNTCMLHVCIY